MSSMTTYESQIAALEKLVLCNRYDYVNIARAGLFVLLICLLFADLSWVGYIAIALIAIVSTIDLWYRKLLLLF